MMILPEQFLRNRIKEERLEKIMDVINTYTYKMSTGLLPVFQIIFLVAVTLVSIFLIYVGIKIIQVCNIYIREHRKPKD